MDEQTQGGKKILVNFKKITATDHFEKEVIRIRKDLKIPPKGITLTKEQLENIGDYIKTAEPEEYNFIARGFHWECKSKYPEETKKLLAMFPAMNGHLALLLRNYIYYNIFLYAELADYSDPTLNVCRLIEAEEEGLVFRIDEEGEGGISVRSHNQAVDEMICSYPVSIRIHPDASQNDVVDFIKKNWSLIKGYQIKSRSKEGVHSFKNSKIKVNERVKERNEFIYKNRDLPRKAIMSLLAEKYGTVALLDPGAIGKVISLEKKKREIK